MWVVRINALGCVNGSTIPKQGDAIHGSGWNYQGCCSFIRGNNLIKSYNTQQNYWSIRVLWGNHHDQSRHLTLWIERREGKIR